MHLHLRLDLLTLLGVAVIVAAFWTGVFLILLALVPVVLGGILLWHMDDQMLDETARERVERERELER